MTKARKTQVSLSDTSYYHCMMRCVRGAFLCGKDKNENKDYSHRKQWIENRLKVLASLFTIDICAYAVMSNHYHVVLHVDKDSAEALSNEEVAERWCKIFNGNLLVKRWREGEALNEAEYEAVSTTIAEWRTRLYDLSWFMRCLNEPIARMANKEDDCKGKFWQSRYKSQALLDEAALLTCMAYVDLNPVRAGIADTPEGSDFTSIQERLSSYGKNNQTAKEQFKQSRQPIKETLTKLPEELQNYYIINMKPAKLKPFVKSNDNEKAIPFTQRDYIQLVDWTGRAVLESKKGSIPQSYPPILNRLGIAESEWIKSVNHYGHTFHECVGHLDALKEIAQKTKRKWLKGYSKVIRRHSSHSHFRTTK